MNASDCGRYLVGEYIVVQRHATKTKTAKTLYGTIEGVYRIQKPTFSAPQTFVKIWFFDDKSGTKRFASFYDHEVSVVYDTVQ